MQKSLVIRVKLHVRPRLTVIISNDPSSYAIIGNVPSTDTSLTEILLEIVAKNRWAIQKWGKLVSFAILQASSKICTALDVIIKVVLN